MLCNAELVWLGLGKHLAQNTWVCCHKGGRRCPEVTSKYPVVSRLQMWKRCGPSLKISSGFTLQLGSLAWQRSCLDATPPTSPSPPDTTVSSYIYNHTIWTWHDMWCTHVNMVCTAHTNLNMTVFCRNVNCLLSILTSGLQNQTRLADCLEAPKSLLMQSFSLQGPRQAVFLSFWVPQHNYNDSADTLIDDIFSVCWWTTQQAFCLCFCKITHIWMWKQSRPVCVTERSTALNTITCSSAPHLLLKFCSISVPVFFSPIFSIYLEFLPEKPADWVVHRISALLFHFFPNMSSFFLQVSNGSLRRNILAVSQQSASVSIYRRDISGTFNATNAFV